MKLVSTGYDGGIPNSTCSDPDVTPDGKYVVFTASGLGILPGVSGSGNLFRKDLTTGQVIIVAVTLNGLAGNFCMAPRISPNGRYVSFYSADSQLVAGDTNGTGDIFVRDIVLGTTERVSIRSTGGQTSPEPFWETDMSEDGRFVYFSSTDSILVPGATNGDMQVYLRDRLKQTTSRISVSSSGAIANAPSRNPSVSADGLFIAFQSDASNLAGGDTNGKSDIFMHNLLTHTTERISLGPGGVQANSYSVRPRLSPDGTKFAFASGASNLVPGDLNGSDDLFMRDLGSGTNRIVSNSTAGVQLDWYVEDLRLDPAFRFVAFSTLSSKPVPNDTNGVLDVFLHDTIGVSVSPTSFTLVSGSTKGVVGSLERSDNEYLVCEPGKSLPGMPQVQVVVEAHTPIADPEVLELYVESSTVAPVVTCILYLYNFSSGSYDQVEARTTGTTDGYFIAHVPADDYVGPKGRVLARIDFLDLWPGYSPPWHANIDHVMVAAIPPIR